jgi:TfoX/Sxy family transcriptional regulator of competence genes
MAYSEELATRVRAAFPAETQVQERKMFGGLAFLLGGHMGCGILGDRLMVRVPPQEHEQTLSEPHVKVMDFTGKPMRGFIYVEPAGIESEAALAQWVRRGAAFASSLPPK